MPVQFARIRRRVRITSGSSCLGTALFQVQHFNFETCIYALEWVNISAFMPSNGYQQLCPRMGQYISIYALEWVDFPSRDVSIRFEFSSDGGRISASAMAV